MDELDERECAIALNTVPTIGGARLSSLIERFGSCAGVLAASEDALMRVSGVGPRTACAIASLRDGRALREELEKAEGLGIRIVTWFEPGYPERLLNIANPPPVLYLKGELLPADSFAIAIVGTRRPTRYGRAVARMLAGGAADAGLCVISGMARGIDSESHRGALERNGRTIAVLGCGLDIVYPPENVRLAGEIGASGALLSERSLGTRPFGQNFPSRNRIISGLALGVVVVEAGERSGALITADFALEQGREVFAVPGEVSSPVSRGTNGLIKQGACLVEGIEDVLEELGIQAPAIAAAGAEGAPVALSARERLLLETLGFSGTSVDDIVIETGLPAATVAATLASLELKGLATRTLEGFARRPGPGGRDGARPARGGDGDAARPTDIHGQQQTKGRIEWRDPS